MRVKSPPGMMMELIAAQPRRAHLVQLRRARSRVGDLILLQKSFDRRDVVGRGACSIEQEDRRHIGRRQCNTGAMTAEHDEGDNGEPEEGSRRSPQGSSAASASTLSQSAVETRKPCSISAYRNGRTSRMRLARFAASRIPAVPTTLRPRTRASFRAGRSSSTTRLASTSSPKARDSLSPAPNDALRISEPMGRVRSRAVIQVGRVGRLGETSRATADGIKIGPKRRSMSEICPI